MKKITLALMAVMLVLGMTQCKKEQPTPTPDPTPDGETVYISMKVDDGSKHIVYPGTGAYVFENGDKIYVGNNGKYVGTLTYGNGTFSGSITNPSTSDYLHFYFTGGKTPASNPSAGSTTSFTVDISNQSSKLPILSYGRSHIKYVDGTTAYSCMLENQCGLVKFVPSTATSEAIIISGMKTTATIDFATPGITPTNTTGNLTLYSVSSTAKWAILLPQNEVENPTITIEGYPFIEAGNIPNITQNSYYNNGINITMYSYPLGGIPGKFTINNSGDQVWFSKGNLQYNKTTNIWSFMEHQYDQVEEEGQTVGLDYKYQNIVSLFGWATSGWPNGNLYYLPYSTDKISNGYGNGYGPTDGTNYKYSLTGDYANADWGVYNAISNGGNTPNQWRTPSYNDWNYIFNTRNTPSGLRYANCKVNNVSGIVLLPDDWNASYHTLNNTNTCSASFDSNVISAADWATMETHGAVFLPATHYRNQGNVSEGVTIRYWSATSSSSTDSSYSLCNLNNNRYSCTTTSRYQGFSVRLVQDVP